MTRCEVDLAHKQLSELFEVRPQIPRFETLEDELSAVEDGRKGMSVFSFTADGVESKDVYNTLTVEASNRGLLLSRITHVESKTTDVLVSHPNEAWRISAYKLMRDVTSQNPYSEGFEMLESLILGYSAEDMTAWLEERRLRTAGSRGLTIFVVLANRDLAELDLHGRKSFHPAVGSRMLAFYNRDVGINGDSVLRGDFNTVLPAGIALCRCAIDLPTWRALFESRGGSSDMILESYIDDANFGRVNSGLLSAIEVLG